MNPLRRFAAALHEMRWSHVVVEHALLIAGILIALAVNGWIDSRRDARLERRYLEPHMIAERGTVQRAISTELSTRRWP